MTIVLRRRAYALEIVFLDGDNLFESAKSLLLIQIQKSVVGAFFCLVEIWNCFLQMFKTGLNTRTLRN